MGNRGQTLSTTNKALVTGTNTMTKEEIQINIDRLKYSISLPDTFQKSYIRVCEDVLKSYEKILEYHETHGYERI